MANNMQVSCVYVRYYLISVALMPVVTNHPDQRTRINYKYHWNTQAYMGFVKRKELKGQYDIIPNW